MDQSASLSKDGVAYLVHQDAPAETVLRVFKEAQEKRREGKTVTVQGMRKNLKRQIDDLAAGGYGNVVKVYRDYSGS